MERSYELSRLDQTRALVAAPLLVALFAALLVTGIETDKAAPLLFGILVAGWTFFRYTLWQPYRVTLSDGGVVFRARLRRVAVPWSELASVGPPGWDVRRGRLNWRCLGGVDVRTSASFVDLHDMLREVERRAPHARVSS